MMQPTTELENTQQLQLEAIVAWVKKHRHCDDAPKCRDDDCMLLVDLERLLKKMELL